MGSGRGCERNGGPMMHRQGGAAASASPPVELTCRLRSLMVFLGF